MSQVVTFCLKHRAGLHYRYFYLKFQSYLSVGFYIDTSVVICINLDKLIFNNVRF